MRELPRSGFGWIDRRFLSRGYAATLSAEANLLYFFLAVVADRKGLSYWSDRAVAHRLAITSGEVERARRELIARQLVLFRAPLYQLLPLPAAPTAACPAPRAGPIVDVGSIVDRVLRSVAPRDARERSVDDRDPDALR